jgi:hypothetical protein
VTRLLLILLLVGSPRDIANRPVKHHVAFPPEPQVVQRKVVSFVAGQPVTFILDFDNPNTNGQNWVIEATANVSKPNWVVVTNGQVGPLGGVRVAIQDQWPGRFYRAGFVWP